MDNYPPVIRNFFSWIDRRPLNSCVLCGDKQDLQPIFACHACHESRHVGSCTCEGCEWDRKMRFGWKCYRCDPLMETLGNEKTKVAGVCKTHAIYLPAIRFYLGFINASYHAYNIGYPEFLVEYKYGHTISIPREGMRLPLFLGFSPVSSTLFSFKYGYGEINKKQQVVFPWQMDAILFLNNHQGMVDMNLPSFYLLPPPVQKVLAPFIFSQIGMVSSKMKLSDHCILSLWKHKTSAQVVKSLPDHLRTVYQKGLVCYSREEEKE